MISIDYVKKTDGGFVINFYADTIEDINNFDPNTSFGIYGKPLAGSLITLIDGEDAVNYYLNDSGLLTKIDIGGDTPTPGGDLTPFGVGQTISAIDFGNVQNGDTSDAMDTFLAGLTYSEGTYSLVAASDESVPLAAGDLSVMSSGEINGYVIMNGATFTMLYSTVEYASQGVSKGYQNIENGKHTLSSSVEVATVSDTEGWNGTLIGAVIAE